MLACFEGENKEEMLEIREKVEAFFEKHNNNKDQPVQFTYHKKEKGRHEGYKLTVLYPPQLSVKPSDEPVCLPDQDNNLGQAAKEENEKKPTEGEESKEEKQEAGEDFDFFQQEEEEEQEELINTWKTPPAPCVTSFPVTYFIKMQSLRLTDIAVYFFLKHSGLGPEEVFFFPIKDVLRCWDVCIVTKNVATDEPFMTPNAEEADIKAYKAYMELIHLALLFFMSDIPANNDNWAYVGDHKLKVYDFSLQPRNLWFIFPAMFRQLWNCSSWKPSPPKSFAEVYPLFACDQTHCFNKDKLQEHLRKAFDDTLKWVNQADEWRNSFEISESFRMLQEFNHFQKGILSNADVIIKTLEETKSGMKQSWY